MNKFELQKLRDLPIEGVAERLGLKVNEHHKCLCPFHEDHHPSMSFKKNQYRCFVCGAQGDSISLVKNCLNKSFIEACRWLAGDGQDSGFKVQGSGFKVQGSGFRFQDSGNNHEPLTMNQKTFDASRYEHFFERPWLSPEARRFLFEERRIDPRVASWCRLTSWKDKQGINWLQTPYYDREGKLIGIQNRNLGSGFKVQDSGFKVQDSGGAPRFRFPQGAECSIYNLPVLKLLQPGEALYITEGCSDCWAMLSAGHKAIAIPSATLLKPRDVELLSTLNSQQSTPFHMYPDRDAPGERLFLQLQKVLPSLVHHQLPPDCKDFSEYFAKVKSEE